MVTIGLGIGIGLKLGSAVKAALIAGAAVAFVSILTWERVKTWFQARQHLVRASRGAVAFSIVERLKSDRYKTVYGIFNEETGQVMEMESVESRSLDETLRAHHASEPLVVYR